MAAPDMQDDNFSLSVSSSETSQQADGTTSVSMLSSASSQMTATSLATSVGTVVPQGSDVVTVLGLETLQEIWKDNELVSLPSWIGRVPHRIGDSKVGKLSADQYRTACTINLVITLNRLWTNKIPPRFKEMLDNYMDLVKAVKLSHMRVLTPRTIRLYEQTILRYLRTFSQLYPTFKLVPSQHLSVHLGQVMRNFGPVHSWRCFPFERYNGLLQNIPTNCKFGKLLFRLFTNKYSIFFGSRGA